jgi:hypothetical protein
MEKKKKAFEKFAMDVLEKAQKVLLLNHYGKISIEYFEYKGEGTSYAESLNCYPYVSIVIRCSSKMLKDFDDKEKHAEIKNALLHEICHPLTDALFNVGYSRHSTENELKNEREKLTDHLANILIVNRLVV